MYFVSKILTAQCKRGVSNNAYNPPNLSSEEMLSIARSGQRWFAAMDRGIQQRAAERAADLAALRAQNEVPRVPYELSLYDDTGRLVEVVSLDPNSPLAQNLLQLEHWLNLLQ